MDFSEYMLALRRRWKVIIGVVVAVIVVTLFVLPKDKSAADKAKTRSWTTFVTVQVDQQVSPYSFDQLAYLVINADVPRTVAKALCDNPDNVTRAIVDSAATGSRAGAARRGTICGVEVEANPDPAVGVIEIATTDDNRLNSETVATSLVDELIKFVAGKQRGAYSEDRKELLKTQAQLAKAVADSGDKVARLQLSAPNTPEFQIARQAYGQANSAYNQATADLRELKLEAPGVARFNKVGPQSKNEASLGVPSATGPRLAIASIVGLLLGLGAALTMERLDNRIRGVAASERATHLPVIAEIPFVRLRSRDRFSTLTHVSPTSLIAESYRGLRTSLSLAWLANQSFDASLPATDEIPGAGTPHSRDHVSPSIILITSPGPNEGKSSTAANLAAAYGETGKRVVVIDLDFRRQRLDRYVGASRSPSLSSMESPEEAAERLEELLQDTELPNVRFVASAESDEMPVHALNLARAAAQRATEIADVVILDAPPLLLTNDTYDLLAFTDALVLVIRDGRTSQAAARRASQLLRRLEAPLVGVALIGVTASSGGGYGYYGYYGYSGYYGYAGYGGKGYGYGPVGIKKESRLDRIRKGRKAGSVRALDAPAEGSDVD